MFTYGLATGTAQKWRCETPSGSTQTTKKSTINYGSCNSKNPKILHIKVLTNLAKTLIIYRDWLDFDSQINGQVAKRSNATDCKKLQLLMETLR